MYIDREANTWNCNIQWITKKKFVLLCISINGLWITNSAQKGKWNKNCGRFKGNLKHMYSLRGCINEGNLKCFLRGLWGAHNSNKETSKIYFCPLCIGAPDMVTHWVTTHSAILTWLLAHWWTRPAIVVSLVEIFIQFWFYDVDVWSLVLIYGITLILINDPQRCMCSHYAEIMWLKARYCNRVITW